MQTECIYDCTPNFVHLCVLNASRFTGKERDQESGNDYFGARYYTSSMGRWMSPDWSAKIEPVPYAKLDDPQTLNLYQYERNNPLGGFDADGHVDWSALFRAGKELVGSVSVKGALGLGAKLTFGSKGNEVSIGVSFAPFVSLSSKSVNAGFDAKAGAELEQGGKKLAGVGGTAELKVIKDNKVNDDFDQPDSRKLIETDKESGVGAFTNSQDTFSVGEEVGDEGDESVELDFKKNQFSQGIRDAWNALKSPSGSSAQPAPSTTQQPPQKPACNSGQTCGSSQ